MALKLFFGNPPAAGSVTHYTLEALTGSIVLAGQNVTLTKVRVGTYFDVARTNAGYTLSNANLTVTNATGGGITGCSFSLDNLSATKLYAEATLVNDVIASGNGVGVGNASADINNWGGADNNSAFIYANNIFLNGAIAATVADSFEHGDTIATAVDTAAQTLSFRNITKSGSWTTPVSIAALGGGPVYFGVSLYDSGAQITANFDGTFVGAAPSGYTRWDGSPAAPVTHYVLQPLTGAVVLAGQNVTLRCGHKAVATVGAVVLGGQSIKLLYGHKAVATAGAVVLGGQNVTLRIGRKMQAGAGAVVLGGQNVTLRIGHKALAGAGAIVLGGQSVTLRYGHKALAAAGAVVFGGQNVTLRYAHKTQAGTGAIVLSGKNVFLGYSGGGEILSALSGSVALSGQSVTLRYTRKMVAGTGAIVLAGSSVALGYGHRAVAGAGAIVLGGQNVDLVYTPAAASHVLTALPGAVVLSGASVELVYAPAVPVTHYTMPVLTGVVTVSMFSAVELVYGRRRVRPVVSYPSTRDDYGWRDRQPPPRKLGRM